MTIGNAFGVGNYCTISQTISRLKKLMGKDRQVSRDFNAISKDLTPITFVELKSLQAWPARKPGTTSKATGKIPRWKMQKSGNTTYHRQFLLDRAASRDINVIELREPQRFAMDMKWLFQSWNEPRFPRSLTPAQKEARDTGVSIAKARCKNDSCLDLIKKKLVAMPNGFKNKTNSQTATSTFRNNWGSNDKSQKLLYKGKVDGFNPITQGMGSLFNEFPPEFKEIYDDINQAVEKINQIEAQLVEVQKQTTNWLNLKPPGWLTDFREKIGKKLDKLLTQLEKQITELQIKIPDLTSDRNICD